jgi:hypothetical protein
MRRSNDHVVYDGVCRIIPTGRNGVICATALIDEADAQICLRYHWCMTSHGYAETRVSGKLIRLHRFIMNFPTQEVDHINGNKLDNRRSNLRVCTRTQNACNLNPRPGCYSRFKGVWKNKLRWCAFITANGKRIYLGNFKTEEQAASAYNHAALRQHGDFARLNKI